VWVAVAILLAAAVPILLPFFKQAKETPVAVATDAPVSVTPPDAAALPAPTRVVESEAPRTDPPVAPRPEPRAAQPQRRTVPPSSIPQPTRPPAAAEVAAAPAPARLTINASPWGQVFIDDVLIGNTPRANIEVAAGEHVIRVSRQGFSTFTRTVRLQAGESLRITDIVLTPVSP
jgi:hypothetical protein